MTTAGCPQKTSTDPTTPTEMAPPESWRFRGSGRRPASSTYASSPADVRSVGSCSSAARTSLAVASQGMGFVDAPRKARTTVPRSPSHVTRWTSLFPSNVNGSSPVGQSQTEQSWAAKPAAQAQLRSILASQAPE